MPFPKRRAAVVGVYLTEQGNLPDRTSASLEIEALKGALNDAGLTFKDVDGIISHQIAGNPVGTPEHMFWPEQLGRRPLGLLESGQAPGALAKAAYAIDSGMCEVVALVFGKAGMRIGPKGVQLQTKAPRVGEWAHTIWGAYMTPWYAMWAQRYMHEFGATTQQLAEISVADRYHATLNPQSIMGRRGPITAEDVINSRMIASPLHLLECSLDNDGGYAIVVTSAERARDLKRKPVYILGGAEASYIDGYINLDKPWFTKEGKSVARSADRAFAMAGVTREDIDVACLYDCFTITAVRDLEEMGFCKLGEGADFIQGGRIRLGGELPLNPHGGLLSASHCGSPGGMFVIELVRQLRGDDVEPARQVKNAKIGVALSQGHAVHGRGDTVIMAAD